MATATATAKNTAKLAAQRAQVSALTMYDWVALDKRGKRMKGEMTAKMPRWSRLSCAARA